MTKKSARASVKAVNRPTLRLLESQVKDAMAGAASGELQQLRRKAERRARSTTRASTPSLLLADVQRLVHELQIHEIELRMQNEELMRAQEEIERSRDRFAHLFNFAPVGYLTLAADQTVLEANQTAARLFDVDANSLVGDRLWRLVKPKDRPALQRHLQSTLRTGTRQSIELPMITSRRDGFFAQLVSEAVRVSPQAPLQIRIAVLDISRQRQAEHALAESRKEVMDAVAREQQRLGSDLHDGLGQNLTAIEYMARALCESLGTEHPALASRAAKISEHLQAASFELRSIARGMVPVNDTETGLMDALDALAQRITSTSGVHCHFMCPSPVRIERQPMADHLFRIAQGAVNNALKHGRPSDIAIRLGRSGDQLTLAVSDNGRGFDPDAARPIGIGLRMMQHRATLIGGDLAIRSSPGKGAEVVCTAPHPRAKSK